MSASGGPRFNVTDDDMIDSYPSYSPDGQEIVYDSFAAGKNDPLNRNAEIYKISTDGTGDKVQLTNNTTEDWQPSWER